MTTTSNNAGHVQADGNAHIHIGNTSNTFNINASEEHTRLEREKKVNAFLKALYTSPYEDRKNVNRERVEGTCKWFMSHQLFRDWQENKSSTTLWVSADPGCGKSVLAKHLVDSVLQTNETRTLCYFFFKDGFKDQTSAASAFCCILRQLFIQKPNLLSDAILTKFETDGEKFTSSFRELWETFINVAKEGTAGEIICLLDALDECEEGGRKHLASKLVEPYSDKERSNLKFLITSRPYDKIRRDFVSSHTTELSVIHLSGESDEEMAKIMPEIDLVIKERVDIIKNKHGLTQDEHERLLRRLMGVLNRTYLWVYLTLDMIEKSEYISQKQIDKLTTDIPATVDDAYNRILTMSSDPEKARRILHIILAAARPLAVMEMALAMETQEDQESYRDIDPKLKDRFKTRIRNLCGLFVIIIDSKVYLLHQTAREFLVGDNLTSARGDIHGRLTWKNCFSLQESHRILAKVCISVLLSDNFHEWHTFFRYACEHWCTHFRELRMGTGTALIPDALRLCDASSAQYLTWVRAMANRRREGEYPEGCTTLIVACFLGLDAVVKQLIQMKGADLRSRCGEKGRSALHWAALKGFDSIVQMLIEAGGRWWKRDVDVNAKDFWGSRPLLDACKGGHVAVVKTLLATGRVDINAKTRDGDTPLALAARYGHISVLKTLLATEKVDIDAKNEYGYTPLALAAENGHTSVLEALLATGKVDVDAKNVFGDTALLSAIQFERRAAVELLLGVGGSNVNAKANDGETALFHAATCHDNAIFKLLLNNRAVDVAARNKKGETALMAAARVGNIPALELLLNTGRLDVNDKDHNGETAFFHAARRSEVGIQFFLDGGNIDINTRNNYGQTALMSAILNPYSNAKFMSGFQTDGGLDSRAGKARSKAKPQDIRRVGMNRGDEARFKLLICHGNSENFNAKDENGDTALILAVSKGLETVVEMLLATREVDIHAKNHKGETAFSSARTPEGADYSLQNHEDILKLLNTYQ